MGEAVRKVLLEHGKLAVDVSELKDDQDLYRSGMTSHASVSVMLALEEEFDLEFPENMLRKSCGFNQSTQQPRRMPQMVTHRRVFVEADH